MPVVASAASLFTLALVLWAALGAGGPVDERLARRESASCTMGEDVLCSDADDSDETGDHCPHGEDHHHSHEHWVASFIDNDGTHHSVPLFQQIGHTVLLSIEDVEEFVMEWEGHITNSPLNTAKRRPYLLLFATDPSSSETSANVTRLFVHAVNAVADAYRERYRCREVTVRRSSTMAHEVTTECSGPSAHLRDYLPFEAAVAVEVHPTRHHREIFSTLAGKYFSSVESVPDLPMLLVMRRRMPTVPALSGIFEDPVGFNGELSNSSIDEQVAVAMNRDKMSNSCECGPNSNVACFCNGLLQ